MKLNIVIAEPRDILRIGLRTIFSNDERTGTIYEATTLKEMNEYLKNTSVDLIVINQSLIEDMHALPRGRFVIMTGCFSMAVLETAYRNGASGYIFENASADLLCATLSLKKGEFLIEPTITAQLIEKISHSPNQLMKKEVLTPREKEIIELLQKGIDRHAIAQQLNISETTLKTHIKNITRKRESSKL